ncbi:hypothetical protein BAE44_0003853 [Dichanthelium oligosanthes]|uniref:Uncharacterized protein n=1 Tax=Dichanthelium oligosanthes TaxID=888268 RepID=A0A1E5WCH3_9POAL|nr:hypothetical protein BAE44_0003853 [Dichanthelium oligosanthes]
MKCIDDLKRSSKKNKRTYLTRSSTKNKTIRNGDKTELLISGDLHLDSNQGFWSELSEEVASKLSESVVSLALSDGHTVLFTCSGIAVQCEGYVTRFLTSASLAKALNDKGKDHDNLQACEGGPHFDRYGNFLGMNLSFSTEGTVFMPKFRLLDTLWHCCTSLEEIKFPKEVRYVLYISNEASTPSYPVSLSLCDLMRVEENSNGEMPHSHQEAIDVVAPVHQDVLNEDQFGDLESLGYPEPPKSMLNYGIILANNFEEPFGDICGKGVWSELSETVASNIHDNTVALASFSGETRFFACTGFFIEWNGSTIILTSASLVRSSGDENKIVENLRIEVLLPNEKLAEGILQHYNLHYNIALVSVNDFCATQPVKIQHRWRDNRELLAVGCIFKSRKLMAYGCKRATVFHSGHT